MKCFIYCSIFAVSFILGSDIALLMRGSNEIGLTILNIVLESLLIAYLVFLGSCYDNS
jgi:hypothetical protein